MSGSRSPVRLQWSRSRIFSWGGGGGGGGEGKSEGEGVREQGGSCYLQNIQLHRPSVPVGIYSVTGHWNGNTNITQ